MKYINLGILIVWGLLLPAVCARWACKEPDPPVSNTPKLYQLEALKYHNWIRERYQAPPLVMDQALNNKAVRCAAYYVKKGNGKIDHSCPYKDGEGENLSLTRLLENTKEFGETLRAIKGFHSEWSSYALQPYNKINRSLDNAGDWGHFSQLVWIGYAKKDRKLGIGYYKGTTAAIVVALYDDPGNIPGGFHEGVQECIGTQNTSAGPSSFYPHKTALIGLHTSSFNCSIETDTILDESIPGYI